VAGVTVAEYGDYECHYCGRAGRALLGDFTDVRSVWRPLPLTTPGPSSPPRPPRRRPSRAATGDLPISRQGTLHPDQLCGTPAFFVNGGPHHGAYDLAGLSATRKRATLGAVR